MVRSHLIALTDLAVVTGGGVVEPARIVIEDDRVVDVGPPGPGVSLPGAVAYPGFVDLHVHGGGGGSFAQGAEGARQAARFHAAHGTTGLLASLPSLAPGPLARAVHELGQLAGQPGADEAEILGIHLEGPWLSPARRGAHDHAALRAPDPDELTGLVEQSGGTIRVLTCAPERPGAAELIARAVELGVVVAAGHTDGIDGDLPAEARLLTHTFNAMRPLGHRDPGLVGQALDTPGMSCEVIADGVHVADRVLGLLYRLVGSDRLILVTDHVVAGGAVAVSGGAARLPDGTLAGSVVTMDRAVARFRAVTGAGPAEAAAVASTNAARLLGVSRGIEAGRRADITVVGPDAEVVATIVAGRLQSASSWWKSGA